MTADTRPTTPGTSAEITDAVEVLSDEYACRILATLDDQPMPAATLATTCDMSRSTAYRRLEQLEAIGFVTSDLEVDLDGHHRKHFHLALDEVRIEVDAEGVAGNVSLTGTSAD